MTIESLGSLSQENQLSKVAYMLLLLQYEITVAEITILCTYILTYMSVPYETYESTEY